MRRRGRCNSRRKNSRAIRSTVWFAWNRKTRRWNRTDEQGLKTNSAGRRDDMFAAWTTCTQWWYWWWWSWNGRGIVASTFKQWGLIESGGIRWRQPRVFVEARNPIVLRAHFTLDRGEWGPPVFVARAVRWRWHVRAKTPAYIYPAPSLRRLSLPARRSERRALLLFSNRQRCGYPV